MTYSSDFRRKVLSVREKEGLTIAQVAARFDVGVASVVRWLKQPEPKIHGQKGVHFHQSYTDRRSTERILCYNLSR